MKISRQNTGLAWIAIMASFTGGISFRAAIDSAWKHETLDAGWAGFVVVLSLLLAGILLAELGEDE